ncbi:MAG: hypothetical protein ABJK83_00350, partial [Parasphingorhabdus sp.]|uniref:hypothetical protein n=1 Tax=Parasphingorhabdus sp. TaxID=2709688 RepID=UPI003298ACDD
RDERHGGMNPEVGGWSLWLKSGHFRVGGYNNRAPYGGEEAKIGHTGRKGGQHRGEAGVAQ